jgi:hypothetical protein
MGVFYQPNIRRKELRHTGDRGESSSPINWRKVGFAVEGGGAEAFETLRYVQGSDTQRDPTSYFGIRDFRVPDQASTSPTYCKLLQDIERGSSVPILVKEQYSTRI